MNRGKRTWHYWGAASALASCLLMQGCGITIKEKQKSVAPVPASEDAMANAPRISTFGAKRLSTPLQDLQMSVTRQSNDEQTERAVFEVHVQGHAQRPFESARGNFKVESCVRGQTEGVICAYEVLDAAALVISDDSSASSLHAIVSVPLAGVERSARLQLRVNYCESKCVQKEVSFAADAQGEATPIEQSAPPQPFKTF